MASGDGNHLESLGTYINELKSNIFLWEDLVAKSQKLNSNLKLTGHNIGSLTESLTSVCQIKENLNHSGIDKIVQMLSDISIREKYISDKILFLNSAIQSHLVNNLSNYVENWKRSINNLKKERDLDGRKAKIELKKAMSEFSKLDSKMNKRNQTGNKNSLSDTLTLQIDYANQNLQNKKRLVDELERCALRKAVCEERNRFKQFLECLRPVLDAQLSMRADLDELQSIYNKLYSNGSDFDLTSLPVEIESYVRQYQVPDGFSSLDSRTNSQLSLSGSLCSSIDNNQLAASMYQLPMNCSPSLLSLPNREESLDLSNSTIQFDSSFDSTPMSLPPPVVDCTVIENEESEAESSSSADDQTERCEEAPPPPPPVSASFRSPLYPNQAMPPPRYANMRELKLMAEKKYGMVNTSRDRPDSTFQRGSNLSANGDRSQLFTPVDYRDHYEQLTPAPNNNSAGIVNYASVYDTLAHVTSNVSTFKRRKPSVVTAMETPTITDKHNFSTFVNPNDVLRSHRTCSVDRTNSDMTRVCADIERTSLGPRHLPMRNSRIGGGCNSMYLSNTMVVPQTRVRLNSYYGNKTPFTHEIIDESIKPANSVNNDVHFKQQLLKVIQGDRSHYQKPVSVLSSQMF